ncbi:hypothetical protein POM88_054300 [Heracleum sosnowskyi]|uniref:Uncharacterized protein n=1 Tax=Heracleum sosnowskyi TaxID=360622 RepID=A0AAD8GNZ4_9APIA|nr:hypothetical protein POM88_054300 [Heracleum sosnowskyi]
MVMATMAMMVFADDPDVGFDIPCFLECAAGCSAHQNIKCITTCFERCIIAPQPPAASPVPNPNPCKLACSNVECANLTNDIDKGKCMDQCYKLSCEDSGL